MSTACPSPTKAEYSSERAARRALRSIRNPQGVMHPYRCGSHWRLGHNDRVDRYREPKPSNRKRARR